MASSDRVIGFSTGAIAKGDFRRALNSLKNTKVPATELSALREHELPELMHSLPQLDLQEFVFVSVHAPTKFHDLTEQDAIRLLGNAVSLRLPIVVHPDTIHSPELWRPFKDLLFIENMDKRKQIGRTASELRVVFETLPEASLCFDVAHARQVDPTMTESAQILREFKDRLREVHASGVSTRSIHAPISAAASFAYSSVAGLIPETIPIILESPVDEAMIHSEINFARDAFSPWLERLRGDIDDVLDLKIATLRKTQAENFLKILRLSQVKLNDFENVISNLPTGGAFGPGELLFNACDLLGKLSEEQKHQLKLYLFGLLKQLAQDYPDLRSEFHEQFASVEGIEMAS